MLLISTSQSTPSHTSHLPYSHCQTEVCRAWICWSTTLLSSIITVQGRIPQFISIFCKKTTSFHMLKRGWPSPQHYQHQLEVVMQILCFLDPLRSLFIELSVRATHSRKAVSPILSWLFHKKNTLANISLDRCIPSCQVTTPQKRHYSSCRVKFDTCVLLSL